MYLFSFQYLTGVISLIVINQKIKIKSDHQDHGSSHCFRSRVHWDRYTILYILVYILRLIFQIIPIGRYKYFIPTFLCKYIVLGYFYYPPPQPKKISHIKKMWPMYPKKWCHSPELNKIRSFLSVSQLLHCTNTVRLSNNSLITNYRNSFH